MKLAVAVSCVCILASCSANSSKEDVEQSSNLMASDFFVAVTQTYARYEEFQGYKALENASDVVVIGTPISVSEGPTWTFNYGDPKLGAGYRNSVVLAVQVEEPIKGSPQDVVHIRFDTGLAEASGAAPPEGEYAFYLMETPPQTGFDDPQKGIPEGAGLGYLLERPEGIVDLDATGPARTPMLQHSQPIAPLATQPSEAERGEPGTVPGIRDE